MMIHYVAACVRNSLQFKANLVGFLLLTTLTYGFRLLFMERLVDMGDGSLGGWDREKVLALYYVGVVVSLVSWSLASSVQEFYRHAYQGDLEPHRMKPVPVPVLIFIRWIAGPNMLALVFVLPLALVDQWAALRATGIVNLLAAGLGVMIAVLGIVSAMLVVYSLTLVVQRQIPVDYIFSELFRLVQVPPTIFTGNWIVLLVMGLPLVVGVWAPVAALDGSFLPLLASAIVATSTGAVAVLTTRASLLAFDGLGG